MLGFGTSRSGVEPLWGHQRGDVIRERLRIAPGETGVSPVYDAKRGSLGDDRVPLRTEHALARSWASIS